MTSWMVGLNYVLMAFSESILIDLVYFSSGKFGKGAGPVFIDYINCTGSEGNIWRQCQNFSHHHGYSHEKDVGVQCKPGQIIIFSIIIIYIYI